MANTTYSIGHVVSQRYEILDIIGRGGQGMVYRALDRWTERVVAIKVLNSKAVREPQMAQRMIREQQALSALKGTAAVELFDVCRGNEGELFLVMELLVGVDLEEYLYSIETRNERMDLFRIVEIFDPIVDTLEVAHRAGILHRDLKPANVFLLEGGAVRLLDFGMARLKNAAPLTAAGTIMGSPSFMAPEAWVGRSDLVDHRADVYSLGVILYRVLAGELPFAGQSLQEKFVGSTTGVRPSLIKRRPDLPRDADEWVTLALAIDRERRFQNVRALWNAFLITFRMSSPKHGKQARSFWSAARAVVRRVAGSTEKPETERPLHRSEPSFNHEALAPSMMRISLLPNEDPPLSGDANAELTAVRVPLAGEPPHRQQKRYPVPPRPRPLVPVEGTIELTDADLVRSPPLPPRNKGADRPAAEKTLELSDSDLVVRDTIPDLPLASAIEPPSAQVLGATIEKEDSRKSNLSGRKRRERTRPMRSRPKR